MNASHTHTGPMLGKDFASELHGSKHYEEFLGTPNESVKLLKLAR